MPRRVFSPAWVRLRLSGPPLEEHQELSPALPSARIEDKDARHCRYVDELEFAPATGLEDEQIFEGSRLPSVSLMQTDMSRRDSLP